MPLTAEREAQFAFWKSKIDEAERLEKQRKWEDASSAFIEAHQIRQRDGLGFESSSMYGLGRVRREQGRLTESVLAYQAAIAWSSSRQDWTANGPRYKVFAADFAIVAAEAGETALSREMLSFLLRWLSKEGADDERIPILVTFEPSAGFVQWQDSATRLKALALAILVAEGGLSHERREETLTQIELLAPDWYWPHAFRASRPDHSSYATAESLSANDEERLWLRRRANGDKTIWRDAAERRANSPVIQRRNRDLLPNAVVVE